MSAAARTAPRHMRSYLDARRPVAHAWVTGRSLGVKARADGGRADETEPSCRGADAWERAAVVDVDVVRVEPVEAARQGLARQVGVGEQPHARQARHERAPVGVRRQDRVVDVVVGDARAARASGSPSRAPPASGRRRARRAARPGGRRPLAIRATVSSRAASADPGPHQDTITVSTPIAAISRICARITSGSEDEYGPRAGNQADAICDGGVLRCCCQCCQAPSRASVPYHG